MEGWNPTEKMLAAGLWALPGPGARTLERIMAVFGADVGAIVDKPFEEWLPELVLPYQAGNVIAAAREAGVRTAQESGERLFARCAATGTRMTFLGEPEYPSLLTKIDRPPTVLFYKGPGAVSDRAFKVAMVGTRDAEQQARDEAMKIAGILAASGVVIVSGAARGIDTYCHAGAAEMGGETWAFLGSSIDQIDPHPKKVMPRILERGGTVFSDFPPGVRSDRNTFAKRNRLIAGASDVTVVLRAPHGSGALITAAEAREQGKPVLAVPGEVWAETALGSNALLHSGAARVVRSAKDIADVLGLATVAPAPRKGPIVLPPDIGPDALEIFEVLKGAPMDFDTLLDASGLSSGQVAAALTALQLVDAVQEQPGRIWCRA